MINDITEYKFVDDDCVGAVSADTDVIGMLANNYEAAPFDLNRQDAIAIAKYFKLTLDDLI